MEYLIAIMGTFIFVIFICCSTMLLNEAIKQTQKNRNSKNTSKIIKHSAYTACYSFIFSSMLIASVYFPFFLVITCGNLGNIHLSNPLVNTRNLIINRAEQSYKQPTHSGFNIFNEIDNTMQRFNNGDVLK